MKILVLADVESKYLWDYFEKEKLEGIDLILSAGDLKPQYLSFLASFSKVPPCTTILVPSESRFDTRMTFVNTF